MDVATYTRRMAALCQQYGVGWLGRFVAVDGEILHYVYFAGPAAGVAPGTAPTAGTSAGGEAAVGGNGGAPWPLGGPAPSGTGGSPGLASGVGVPLVLIHGLAAWSFTWRHNAPALAAAGPVYALDLPGFGLSSKTGRAGYSLWDQARWVLRFLDIAGLQRAVLVGNSMGGEIALRLALTVPGRVAGLVLVSSAGYAVAGKLPAAARAALALPLVGRALVRAAFMSRRFAAQALQAAYGDPTSLDPAAVVGYWLPSRTPGAARTLLRVLREMDFGATAHRLHEVQHPALIVWGARDPWTPLDHGQRLHRALRHSRLHVFPTGGHVVHEEFPDAFNRLVLNWVRELAAGAPARNPGALDRDPGVPSPDPGAPSQGSSPRR